MNNSKSFKSKTIVKPTEEELTDRHKEIKDLFTIFDKDNSGTITSDEVKSLLTSLGRETTTEEIQKLVSECDKDKNGTIELQEFINWMDNYYVIPPGKVEEVVDAFRIFDLDKNGYVNLAEFKDILMKFGGDFTEEEVNELFKETDVNKDGKLTYAEFVELWKYQ